jgi:hypothetical protein
MHMELDVKVELTFVLMAEVGNLSKDRRLSTQRFWFLILKCYMSGTEFTAFARLNRMMHVYLCLKLSVILTNVERARSLDESISKLPAQPSAETAHPVLFCNWRNPNSSPHTNSFHPRSNLKAKQVSHPSKAPTVDKVFRYHQLVSFASSVSRGG